MGQFLGLVEKKNRDWDKMMAERVPVCLLHSSLFGVLLFVSLLFDYLPLKVVSLWERSEKRPIITSI